MKHVLFIILALSLTLGLTPRSLAFTVPKDNSSFHATNADEYEVRFQAVFRTRWTELTQIQKLNEPQRLNFKNEYLLPTLKYLYGPLTHREWGSPQRGFKAELAWDKAYLEAGRVYVPYTYLATWILHREFLRTNKIQIPVPYTAAELQTENWRGCTDSQPDHQTISFYWYFWDPQRRGCDHKEGRDFQLVNVELGTQTINQKATYPEYPRMFTKGPRGEKQLNMTLAFGYVEETHNPLPDTDKDIGAQQYQDFISYMRKSLGTSFRESEILQKEYGATFNPEKLMGHRFQGLKSGVRITINVVAAAEIDQMEIFAKSFAQDHESFFAWFGHSRVGEGFDADRLSYKLKTDSRKYSITDSYQMIYWAGCNSYSYYTLPFFQMKVSTKDPLGTKNLDIISNGLPSFFALNSINAKVILAHLLNWQKRPSYQTIIKDLENGGRYMGATRVLINVLGDEDNP